MHARSFPIFPIIKEIPIEDIPDSWVTKGKKTPEEEEEGGERARKKRKRRKERDYV